MRQSLGRVLLAAVLLLVLTPGLQAAEQPIVIYSLQFIELNEEATQSLQAKFSVDKSQPDKKWQIISKQEVLNYLQAEKGEVSASLQSRAEREKSRVHYDSWLTTVNKKQVAIKLKERLINQDGEERQAYLKFQFQPERIKADKNEILTEVKFSYQGRQGIQSETETKALLSQEKQQPVAVVTQKVEGDGKTVHRYFALYVRATAVSSEAVEKRNALLAMGNLQEINQLFGRKNKSSKSSNLKLAGYLGKKAADVRFNWQMNKYKLGAEVRKKQKELLYQTNIGYRLLGMNNLFVLGCIGGETSEQEEPVIRLGLRDKVTWWELINLEVAYFPLSYRIGSEVKRDSTAEVELGLETANWKAWYAGRYVNDSYLNGGGLSYNLTSNWELAGKWEENNSGNGKIYLGLIWKLNE